MIKPIIVLKETIVLDIKSTLLFLATSFFIIKNKGNYMKILNIFVLLLTFISLNLKANEVTTRTGAKTSDNLNSKISPDGKTLLEDGHLLEKLSSFNREKIPERVVHARGTAIKGEFKTTEDLSHLTTASIFGSKNKKTDVLVRFSSVIHPKGSPETLRDPRGFAIKFYTDEGNWDLVGNNLPVFFIKDAMQFPDMVNSLKPDPTTNLQDPNRFFDFFSFKPEATNMLTYLYSTLGIPKSYKNMDGAGVHAYKFINEKNEVNYVKFTWKTKQGVEGLSPMQAAKVQATNFNHLTADLYSKEKGSLPAIWDMYIQIINQKDLNKFSFNPLDATKIWPENEVAMQKIGELVLDEIPDNFHKYTEQSAFAPSNLVRGIKASEDRLLQGRLFAYADTQNYRLGVNHKNLEPNLPLSPFNSPATKEGHGLANNSTSSVNYFPSRNSKDVSAKSAENISNQEQVTVKIPYQKEEFFKQAGVLYRSFSSEDQKLLVEGIKMDLGQVKSVEIKNTIASFFFAADEDYGVAVANAVDLDLGDVKKLAQTY